MKENFVDFIGSRTISHSAQASSFFENLTNTESLANRTLCPIEAPSAIFHFTITWFYDDLEDSDFKTSIILNLRKLSVIAPSPHLL